MAPRAEDASPDDVTEHYFSADATADSDPTFVSVVLPDVTLRLRSDRGVFSAGRLDPGTKLLLVEMPELEPSERTVLDLGCGWGAIACVAAHRAPRAQVWAVDVNRRARQLTKANADIAGVHVTVAAPEAVPDDIRFDRILSNPPIRVGKHELHRLLGSWLDRLMPTGRAHLVVHRHLGSDSLIRWLSGRGHHVTRLVSRSGYRLIEVSPRSPVDP